MRKLPLLVPSLVFGLSVVAGCDKKDQPGPEQGAQPPPIQSSKPGACQAGGGTPGDKASAQFFPRKVGEYCVDPNGETRAYGENADSSLDKVCTEQFDGECEVYKGYGLKRVVTLRYIDGKGSPGSVSVNLSRFANKEGAYGFFTKRVLADSDPTEASSKLLEAGAAGALGSGIAYVWRGEYVAELSYANELESPDQLTKSSDQILPPLAKSLGDKLTGDMKLPAAAAVLPEEKRIKLGLRYEAKDVLDISGVGPGALGYYQDGDKRWRLFAVVRPDEESAKDVFNTLKKLDGAKSEKGVVFDALNFSLREDDESPKTEWLVGRKGARLIGIGDEEFVLRGDKPEAEAVKYKLTQAEKLERLKALIDGDKASAKPE